MTLPRIKKVDVTGPTSLDIAWSKPPAGGKSKASVDLTGWIATGGDILAPLKRPEIFAKAEPGNYGAAVVWDNDGDLAIDAHHLSILANEQSAFGSADIQEWQSRMKLSNQEAADFFGVALSTWNSYKAGAAIPSVIAMVCRASVRDPILLQAHFHPRKAGRPKKASMADLRKKTEESIYVLSSSRPVTKKSANLILRPKKAR